MKILVTGGSGLVGSAVVAQLRKHDVSLRLLMRKEPEKKIDGVEVAIGDLLDPISVEKALQGVDKLYLLNAVSSDELTQALIAYDLARKAKLKHIVYHSVYKVEDFKDVPHFASKLAVESAMHQFDLPFTIIRPNYFYQNDIQLKDALLQAGVYPMPLGSEGVAAVDVRDIAEATAISLTGEKHYGKTYNLVGPYALSGQKAASVWSEALGKEIKYPGENMDSFEENLRKKMPAWSAFDLRMMLQGYLERGFKAGESDVKTLTDLLGHEPRSYDEFARETASSWKTASKI